MKRSSLILLVMASMFVMACDVDSGGNKNASDRNNNISSNSNAGGPQSKRVEGVTAGDPGVITIAVVVCYDANRNAQVRVTEPIYVSPGNSQKVRWCVYNDLDISLASVSISAFNSGGSGAASLCSNTPNLTTGQIPAGNRDAVCTESCAAAPSPAGTSFQYTVTAKPEGQKEVTALGPRVIIQ
ncbi:MAG TPA: hypothetical protein VNI02_23955 [Blastocatellia bacterium]|jgi:hypothetical protein|nr:hypothetical protein [Blastocatellia bacterium]